jgi:WD40 repeat protein
MRRATENDDVAARSGRRLTRRELLISGGVALAVAVPVAGYSLRSELGSDVFPAPEAGSGPGVVLNSRSEWVYSVAFGSRDGVLAVGCDARTLSTGAPVTAMAFAADGNLVAGGSASTPTKVWIVSTGQQLATLDQSQDSAVTSLSFSPDGRFLAGGCGDHTVRVWKPLSGRLIAVLSGHTDVVAGVRFSPDSRTLASSGKDLGVRLWDVPAMQQVGLLTSRFPMPPIDFSPDGKTLAVGGLDNALKGTIQLWDVSRQEIRNTLGPHGDGVCALAFSAQGMLACGDDIALTIWNPTRERVLSTRTVTDVVNSLSFRPDDRVLAAGLSDGTVGLF